jgi:hypothetical protein
MDADKEFTMLANVKFLIWTLVGIGASVGLIYLANERLQPVIVDRTVTVNEMATEIKQVETFYPARKQELLLNLIKWIAVAILLTLAGLMILWFSLFFLQGEQFPKELDALLKYLVAGVLGALLGVVCTPTVDSMDIINEIQRKAPAAQPR